MCFHELKIKVSTPDVEMQVLKVNVWKDKGKEQTLKTPQSRKAKPRHGKWDGFCKW